MSINIGNWAGGALALLGIAGIGWKAALVQRDLETRWEALEQRVSKIQTSATPGASVFQSPEILGQVRDLENRVEQIETVNSATKSTTNLDRPEKIQSLFSRVTELEKASSSINPNRPIVLYRDYAEQFETQSAGNLDISLKGCYRTSGTRVRCSLILNNRGEMYGFYVFADQGTRLYLPNGQAVSGSRVAIGEVSNQRNFQRDFPTNIPVEATVEFSVPDRDVSGLPAFRFQTNVGTVEFRNVTVATG